MPSTVAASTPTRCRWADAANPAYLRYHDDEWGVPSGDETHLFEMLNLEGAQAGLSWATVLAKRDAYRRAFDGWDADRVARYGPRDVARLMGDAGIIRNRLKIEAAIANARAVLPLRDAFGGLVPYLWSWVGGEPVVVRRAASATAASRSPLSEALSKDLATRGFRFIGPTIVYAYLQAVGVLDDHDAGCFRHAKRRGS